LDADEFAALASPAPLSIAEVQDLLAAGDAPVLFLDAPDRMLPTPEQTAWRRSARALG
jgi:hypothetical protein